MRVWVEQPHGFSHSTNHKGIKETQEEAEKVQKKGGEKERKTTTQSKMSNKEYENMRGRRDALTESKKKIKIKNAKEGAGQAWAETGGVSIWRAVCTANKGIILISTYTPPDIRTH